MNTFLFDFDGTLVDSMPTYTQMFYTLLDNNNVKYDKDIIKAITPLGFKGSVQYLLDHTDIKLTAEEISKFFEVVKMLGVENVRLDVDTTKYNLNDFKTVPSHYKELYDYFKSKANELNLTLFSDEQIECILNGK